MDAILTFHAAQRLAERTTLTEDKLFHLIDSCRCVIVGIEPYTNRLHKLIYSEQDKTHFVVIQDMATREVITILPLDYHENLAWKISPKKLKQAVFRVSPVLHSSLYPAAATPVLAGIKCDITLVIHSPGLRALRKNFGRHRFATCPVDADDALGNTELIEKLLHRCREHQVPIDEIEEILLSDPKHDFLLKIPWETLAYFQDDIEINEQPSAGAGRMPVT